MGKQRIQLARMAYRVVLVREHSDGDYYEVSLSRDGRTATIYLDQQHAAAGLTIGSEIELAIEAVV